MIFITVGSVGFDNLIKAVDILKGNNLIQEHCIAQIGTSEYKPDNLEFFDHAVSIAKYINEADLIISHGGVGTVQEVITARKKLVAVPNPKVADNHQYWFLRKLENTGDCIVCTSTIPEIVLKNINRAKENSLPEIPFNFFSEGFLASVKKVVLHQDT